MTAPKPLLSNETLEAMCSKWLPRMGHEWAIALKVRDFYEEDRRKKDELIQQLVDALEQSHRDGRGSYSITMLDALEAAEAHGFKPTEP